MALPEWAAPGTPCICIDDDWSDPFGEKGDGRYPRMGEHFTISVAHDLGLTGFIALREGHIESELYEVAAFRPLTQLEADVAMFDEAFKGVAAPVARQSEPA